MLKREVSRDLEVLNVLNNNIIHMVLRKIILDEVVDCEQRVRIASQVTAI